MTLKQLQDEMVAAMKSGNKDRKDAISSLISAAKNLAIAEKRKDDIGEDIVDKAILKEQKTVKEQIDSCPAERADLLEKYKLRYAIIGEFAPQMMTEDEIINILKTKFSDVIATGNKGAVMKAVMAELKGKADGKLINQCVATLMK